jgi:protein-S-isoprenylcysteine O-methyltransferase Ste14
MKVSFTPPDLILVFVIVQILAHFLFPIKQIILYPFNLVGILLIIAGQIPNFWIYLYFGKRKNSLRINKIPNVLITSRFFRFSRNPNYLGMAITLFGVSILAGSFVTFIFPILFIILTNILVISIEERNLEKKFGKKYLRYKRQVRRWI